MPDECTAVFNSINYRGPDKEGFTALFPTISLIIQPNPMLWVLKRIVSLTRFL